MRYSMTSMMMLLAHCTYAYAKELAYTPSPVHVRFPPVLINSTLTTPGWKSPPTDFIYGTWWIAQTSQPSYQAFRNMQMTFYPLLPQTSPDHLQNADITTFQTGNTSNVTVEAGVDTFSRVVDPWQFSFFQNIPASSVGPAFNITNTWDIIAWGYDENGVEYYVNYSDEESDGEPAGLDFQSRARGGLQSTSPTFQELALAILELGAPELTELLKETKPLLQDSSRDAEDGFILCTRDCLNI